MVAESHEQLSESLSHASSDEDVIVDLDELLQSEDVIVDLDELLQSAAEAVVTAELRAKEALCLVQHEVQPEPLKNALATTSPQKKIYLKDLVYRAYCTPWPLYWFRPTKIVVVILITLSNVIVTMFPGITRSPIVFFSILNYFLVSCFAVPVLCLLAGLPKRFYPVLVVWQVSLQGISAFMLAVGSPGLLVAWLSFAVACYRSAERPILFVLYCIWLVVIQFSLIVALYRISSILDVTPNTFKGFVMPIVGGLYSKVGLILLQALVVRWAVSGTPMSAIAGGINLLVATTEMLKLGSYMQAALAATTSEACLIFFTTSIVSVGGDIVKRLQLITRFLSLTSGRKFQIRPETDCLLRGSFYLCYVLTFPAAILIGLWCIWTGAPWATSVWFWLSFPMFTSASLVGDAIVIFAHRRSYPINEESTSGTWVRLNRPGQHFPAFQIDGGRQYRIALECKSGNPNPVGETGKCGDSVNNVEYHGPELPTDDAAALKANVWGSRAVDEFIAMTAVVAVMGNVVHATMSAVLGQCRLSIPWDYADEC